MAVVVLEVAGITALEHDGSWLDNRTARALNPLHDGINLGLAAHVVPNRKFGAACATRGQLRIMGDVGAASDSQTQSGLQLKKSRRAMRERAADDPFGRQTKSVAIEFKRSLQIIDAQCVQS